MAHTGPKLDNGFCTIDVEEERKLFYVAVTRVKKYLYLSRSETSRDKDVSTFLMEAKDSSYLVKYDGTISYHADNIPSMKKEAMPVSLNYEIVKNIHKQP